MILCYPENEKKCMYRMYCMQLNPSWKEEKLFHNETEILIHNILLIWGFSHLIHTIFHTWKGEPAIQPCFVLCMHFHHNDDELFRNTRQPNGASQFNPTNHPFRFS